MKLRRDIRSWSYNYGIHWVRILAPPCGEYCRIRPSYRSSVWKGSSAEGRKSSRTNVVSILLIIFHLQEGQIRERSCQEEPEVEQQQQPAPLQHTYHRGPRSSSGHRSVAGSVSSLAQPLPPPAELPALDMPAFDFQRWSTDSFLCNVFKDFFLA